MLLEIGYKFIPLSYERKLLKDDTLHGMYNCKDHIPEWKLLIEFQKIARRIHSKKGASQRNEQKCLSH